jgi:hypothetical protein
LALTRELIREVRDLDEYDLRRLTIFIRGLLLARDADDPDATGAPPAARGKVTYRQERVRCGREGCSRCPHGPYWYAYWREGGRLRSRYIGKHLPTRDAPSGPVPVISTD